MFMQPETSSPQPAAAEAPFLAEVQRGLTRLAGEYRSAEATLDLLFLSYLLHTSRFGYFTYGPVTIDVRLIEDLVARTVTRSGPQSTPVGYSEDCLRFFRTLSEEVERSGRRRVDELHLLVAFMRVNDGIPGRVFAELGVRPEEVLRYVPERADTERRLYTPEEAAEYLGVHVKTVRNWIRSGRLPASRLAGQRALRIRSADLERILEPVDPAEFETEDKGDQ
jgi:excisionase family DNA binding protein